MSWVSISVAIMSVLQLFFLTKVKWRFISIIVVFIVRFMFLMRVKGIIFKLKPLWIAEALVGILQLVAGMIKPETMNWLFFALLVLDAIITICIEFLDDKFYVYKVEDYKEEAE